MTTWTLLWVLLHVGSLREAPPPSIWDMEPWEDCRYDCGIQALRVR